jgi:competence protein ComEA
MLVYVSGAVRAPDVYWLRPDARVKDVVVAAGGFADGADSDAINLAARLEDGQHIHVPWQGQIVPQEQATGDDDAGASGEAPDALLDLNRADASDLEGLPGVGSTMAERIIAYRDEHGPFTSVDELRQVKGIGPALFAKIAPLVRVGS